jgi:asparagine synthase (glutamine-hydrolysing)
MVDPVTGRVIVFNGEIYNFRDLRRRLAAEAQKLRSTGDTAVMLRALGLHGAEASAGSHEGEGLMVSRSVKSLAESV